MEERQARKKAVAVDCDDSDPDLLTKATYVPPRVTRYGSVLRVTGSDMGGSLFDIKSFSNTAKMA